MGRIFSSFIQSGMARLVLYVDEIEREGIRFCFFVVLLHKQTKQGLPTNYVSTFFLPQFWPNSWFSNVFLDLFLHLQFTARFLKDEQKTIRSVQEHLNLHDAPSTGQIWTIDPIFLSIFPIYGVIYHAFMLWIWNQSLHVFQN